MGEIVACVSGERLAAALAQRRPERWETNPRQAERIEMRIKDAILMLRISSERSTTFFLANQLPFYAGLPLGLMFGIGAIRLSGSVANALVMVGCLFLLGAAVWLRPTLRELRASGVTDASASV